MKKTFLILVILTGLFAPYILAMNLFAKIK